MKFNLIVCTYQRAKSLLTLLISVEGQNLYPDEILVIDGSLNEETQDLLQLKQFKNLKYFKVQEENRGLTKQRNFGIEKTSQNIEIICFLDDDTVLEPNYFEQLIATYKSFPDAVGVGGYILNEIEWKKNNGPIAFNSYEIDGFIRKLGGRNLLRKRLGLLSHQPPGRMPDFSNGLAISFLPPSGKVYPVDFFMGGVSSYRKFIFEKLKYSEFFQGYGLYEDMDFCLRASKLGALYVNTSAKLNHYHEKAGRPKRFNYGIMVLRNGWYVWRVKYPTPPLKAKLKWHATSLLLALVKMGNAFTEQDRKAAFSEAVGRFWGWGSLFFKKPIER